MISGSAGLLFDNHTPVDSLRFCQKLHNVIDTLQSKAEHLLAQETNAKTLIPIFFWINSRMRRTRKYSSRDLNRQEKWGHKNLITFSHVKCKVLHLGRNNPRHQYMPGLTGWKIALQRRNWTLVALVHTHTRILILASTESSNASILREVILPLSRVLVGQYIWRARPGADRHGCTGERPEKGNKGDYGIGVSDVQGMPERAGTQPGAKAAQGDLIIYKSLVSEGKETEPGSSQWKDEVIGTNLNTRNSIQM